MWIDKRPATPSSIEGRAWDAGPGLPCLALSRYPNRSGPDAANKTRLHFLRSNLLTVRILSLAMSVVLCTEDPRPWGYDAISFAVPWSYPAPGFCWGGEARACLSRAPPRSTLRVLAAKLGTGPGGGSHVQ